jgi:hypothetical protein
MSHLPAIFSLLVAAAGWYYLFFSRATERLAVIESPGANRLRIRLRRAGAVAMILLAVSFYLGNVFIERENAVAAISFILAVPVLLFVIVALALVDLRLTRHLRKKGQQNDRS